MKIKEIAFVCYPVNDLKRARGFYEGVLGLKPGSVWEGEGMGFVEYWMGDHTLALGQGAAQYAPGKMGGTAALEVEDFEEAVKELREKKVPFLMEPMKTGVCHMALIEDTEGNQIMIHRRHEK